MDNGHGERKAETSKCERNARLAMYRQKQRRRRY